MGPTGKAPTKDERRWIAACREFGCAACHFDGYPHVQGEYHHLVEANKRVGHRFGFVLCSPGHHQPDSSSGKIAIHPGRSKTFAKVYGTEREILARIETLLGFEHV